MKTCNFELSKKLHELGYDGKFRVSWVVQPNSEPEIEFYAHDDWVRFPKGTTIYDSPRLDDASYFLRDKYHILIVIDPYIYNGVIYNYIPRIYSPHYFEEEPKQSKGVEVYDEGGQYFLDYEDALEAAIIESIKIIGK